MGQLLALFDFLTVALLIVGCLLIWGGLRPQNAILLQESPTPTIQAIPPKEVTPTPPRPLVLDYDPSSVAKALTELGSSSDNHYAKSVSVAVAKSRQS
jgi:hypothetical protein